MESLGRQDLEIISSAGIVLARAYFLIIISLYTICICSRRISSTYDHRIEKIEGPVRSPVHKLDTAGSVVGSVTTSESPVLYVLFFCLIKVSHLSLGGT